jgi:crotonobetainyl-CoA:carnitine CoA-transferase CaiB-like acyl-CoA transferase
MTKPMQKEFSAGPLTGITIVDLSTVIMGPYATHILADMGAEVIKVETPDGDIVRTYKPMRNPGMSGMFLQINRNKRSLVLDLKKPEGMSALRRVIARADAFLHTMRPDAIARLGLSYGEVASMSPDIVYCGAYGFGADGPYRNKPAYDDIIQAGSGLASLNVRRGGQPAYLPTIICDKLCGQTVAYAMLAALLQKARGGGGGNVEVPMLETSIEFALVEHMGGRTFVPQAGEMGFRRILGEMRKPFRTADGFACILPYSTRNWTDFLSYIGREGIMADERFSEPGNRIQNIDVLYRIIEEAAPQHTTQEWVSFCDERSIPCMPIVDLDDLEADPHVRAVDLFQDGVHPTEGPYRMVRRPVSFSGSDFAIRHHAPRLGEHTRQVLAEAGLDEAQIEDLVRSAACVADRGPTAP